MKYYRRHAQQTRKRGENSFWLCFADLMSALLLMFVLVLFYVLHQMLARSDDLAITTAELMLQQEQVATHKLELEEKDMDLQASEAAVMERDLELELKQAKLLLLQKENEEVQALLEQQQTELDGARTQLNTQQVQLVGQQQKMTEQQQSLDALVGIRTRIIASLATALSEANVRATVDQTSGSITMDSSVLFDSGSSELKESGKQMIDQFLPVYLSVMLNDDYRENISEIIIEGHTDTVGDFSYNLELSQRRAATVVNYILSDNYSMISQSMKEELRKITTANGRSFAHPILKTDGEIDLDASRRVEFKFRMQDEQMIESMRELLETMD